MFEIAATATDTALHTTSAAAPFFSFLKSGVAMVVLLGVLIFVHELGHFLAARKKGIGVEVFALGFGQPLYKRNFGETEFRICAFPLGGYVKLLGEDPEVELPEERKKESFSLATPFTRLMIAFAGPFFNLLFAVFVFFVVYMIGVPVLGTTVGKVVEKSAAAEAGLVVGDKIIALNGKPVTEWSQLTSVVHNSAGIPVQVEIERVVSSTETAQKTEVLSLTITPKSSPVKDMFGEEIKVGLIGILPDSNDYTTKRYNPASALYYGFMKTVDVTWLTLVGIAKMIEGIVPKESVGGPILIMQLAGQQVDQGLMQYAVFVAFISINLGIINLFPVPVLDGGHITFALIEIVMRRPLKQKIYDYANRVGIALLATLMIFAFYNDIMRLVTG